MCGVGETRDGGDRRARASREFPARDAGREDAVYSNDRTIFGLEGFVEETQGDAPSGATPLALIKTPAQVKRDRVAIFRTA
jgi:hypothetical protein